MAGRSASARSSGPQADRRAWEISYGVQDGKSVWGSTYFEGASSPNLRP